MHLPAAHSSFEHIGHNMVVGDGILRCCEPGDLPVAHLDDNPAAICKLDEVDGVVWATEFGAGRNKAFGRSSCGSRLSRVATQA